MAKEDLSLGDFKTFLMSRFNDPAVTSFSRDILKSACHWALVSPCNPCFIPSFLGAIKPAKLGAV